MDKCGYITNRKNEFTSMDKKYNNHNSFYMNVDDTKNYYKRSYNNTYSCDEDILLIIFIIGILFCGRCFCGRCCF